MLVHRKIGYEFRELLGHNKTGIRILAKWSGWRNLLVRRDSGVCIEGFPRSANTYAVIAFQVAQRDPGYHMAHHSHLAGNVLRAVSYRVPCVVLLRDPEDAVLSLKLYSPHLSMGQCLRAYCRFHREILPVCSELAVVLFDEIVSDFNVLIDRLNARYHRHFKSLSSEGGDRERVEERLRALERRGVVACGKNGRDQGVIQSERRRMRKCELACVLSRPEIRGPLKEAKRSYEEILDTSGLDVAAGNAGK